MTNKSLLGICLAGLLALVVNVASAIEISVFPQDNIVERGTPVDVLLKISGLGDLSPPSLGAFDIDISFNPVILSLANVSFGDPLGDQLDLSGLGAITEATPGAGTVNLVEVSLDPTDVLNDQQLGEFFLATLTFNTLALGESLLSLTINGLGDANGEALVATAVGGRIGVNDAPIPSTLLLLTPGLVALLRLRGLRCKLSAPNCA